MSKRTSRIVGIKRYKYEAGLMPRPGVTAYWWSRGAAQMTRQQSGNADRVGQQAFSANRTAGMVTMMILASSATDQFCA